MFAVIAHLAPFGMRFRHDIMNAGREINGHINVDLLCRIKLCTKQIEGEMRMAFPDLRIVIRPPVMPGCKAGYGIEMTGSERLLPLLFLEVRADTIDGRRGVKIKMDLPVS